jgi:hypothetical protein
MTAVRKSCQPLYILALLLLPVAVMGQPRVERGLQFGGGVSGLLGTPTAEFSQLPGVANCIGSLGAGTAFDGGSGGGFAVSALVGISPLPAMDEGFLSHIGADLSIGYAGASTTFEVDERIGQAIDPAGNILPIFSRYTVETQVSELRLEPMARYYIGPSVPLTFGIGAKLGFLLGATYDQKETIASPSGATYGDGSSERNASSGDLAETSGMQAGLKLALGYDVPLSKGLALRPELTGLLALNSPVQGVTWNPNELRFGLSIVFTQTPLQSTPLQPVEPGEGR